MLKCSNDQMIKYSNVQMFKCSNTHIFKCSNAQMLKFSNVQVFKYSKVQMFKSSNVQISESSPHDKCGAKCVIRRNLSCFHMKDFSTWAFFSISLSQLTLFCFEICFVAFYADFSRNLLCCDLRASVWRKIEPTIVPVEKKSQISGMIVPLFQCSNIPIFICSNIPMFKY